MIRLLLLVLLGACQPGTNSVGQHLGDSHDLSLCWGIRATRAVPSVEWSKSCAKPQIVHYTDLPLKVYTRKELFPYVKSATDAWNTDLKMKLFEVHEAKVADDFKKAHIVVIQEQVASYAKEHDNHKACPEHKTSATAAFVSFDTLSGKHYDPKKPRILVGGRDYISIVHLLPPSWDPDILPSLLIHELGHSLGLAHDRQNARSIMFPYYNGWILPKIEVVDLHKIRTRYAGLVARYPALRTTPLRR